MGVSDDNPLGTSVCWSVSPLPVPHKDLPSRLWHVQHRHSQSVVNDNGGLTAATGYQNIGDEHDLKLQAIRHFNWDTYLYDETLGWKSCFISAFGDSRHAEKWGKRRVGQVTIYEIDVAKLPSSTIVFDAVKLCDDLAIAHPWSRNEFIFLHEIPWQCVGDRFDLIGGQYYWQPKWPVSYISCPHMQFRSPVLGTGLYTLFGLPMLEAVPMGYPTSPFHHLTGPYVPLRFFVLGTWPVTYPASQYYHRSGGLYSQSAPYRPVESANTKDSIESLIKGLTDALRINDATDTSKSNASNNRREG